MSDIIDFTSTSAKNESFTLTTKQFSKTPPLTPQKPPSSLPKRKTSQQTRSTQMESSNDMSNKLIADINKKIAEEKKLNGPEQKVVKISLPQIDPKVRFDVLDSIYNFFQADRIGENLYIKFDSGEKEDIYDELRSSLKEQLPEWWSQEKVACVVHSNEYYPDVGSWQQKPSHKQRRFPFIYNCPPPQIWIEVAYNITNDRERALEKIRSSKCYCCKTEFIIIVLPHGKGPYHQNPNPGSDSEEVGIPLNSRPSLAPYIGYWPSNETFDRVSWHDIVWNQHLSIGYGVRIYFNDILKYLTEDDDDYENPKPCPYCGEIIPNPKGMVRHIKENCQHDFY
ncbi:unnamed protein product [Rhizophagus irregularis]|uniref:Uncharacterized protein n=1 Tax=Rhizophagus irregularis TaxID=588596 RepID=A0A2I1GVL1_9GLOM|nr:hypothetical protein RhiirA4_467262 [Rhizophagus irregularis]CAB4417359.1 unnamed protein product [Rhizophagus irregularis]CAB4418118.1 unnamed protein product [Rhizophagus irregularis]